MKAETLFDEVNRAKHRWLRDVMYHSEATNAEKCLAYIIMDLLNCVTLDIWPSQLTLAGLLGVTSVRTVQRAAGGLALRGLITIKVNPPGNPGLRHAPVLRPEYFDKPVTKSEQISRQMPDKNVRESCLRIQLESYSMATARERPKEPSAEGPQYRRSERGRIEVKLAERLGSRGLDILDRLHSIDDGIIDRLCRAFVEDKVGHRELKAARLAADQVR